MTNLIEADDLTAAYRSKTVWSDANFKVGTQEFVGLLGANGAGKSTLFKLILGLSQPAGGKLKVFGKSPRRGNPNIGYMPQRRFIESESRIEALEYVRLGLIGTKFGFSSPSQARLERAKAAETLALVDATELGPKPLNELSGGELQRVFLAQALVNEPKLLLLDEPLANLDIKRETELVRLVSSLVKQQKISVILIAHDINPLLPVVNQIIYIANGKIATGNPSTIITSDSLSKLYNAPVEVLRDSHGRLAVLGVEEAVHHE